MVKKWSSCLLLLLTCIISAKLMSDMGMEHSKFAHGQILPLVFSLLPSKSKKCYRFMWTKLNELMAQKGMHPNLKEFRSDLEIAPMKTLLLFFIPDSVSTYFFHFAQAHWRKIQSLVLMELYTSNEDYSLLLRCFPALAFVPEARIIEYFNLSLWICSWRCPYRNNRVHCLCCWNLHWPRSVWKDRWWCKWWISSQNKKRTNMEKAKVLTKAMVSAWQRVLNEEPRTTNMLEGWHRKFSSIVAKHHPNIYDFLGCLRSEQSRTETVITKLLMGDGQRTRKASQAKRSEN